MPPLKELHFFDRRFPHRRALIDRMKQQGGCTDRERAFLDFVMSLRAQPEPDPAVYKSIFRFAGDRLSGDITPAYAGLDHVLVARIAAAFPALKVILMLRDPIERFWSNVTKAVEKGSMDAAALTGVSSLQRLLLERPSLARLSFPSQVHRRWAAALPDGRLRWFFLEQVASDPAGARADILWFLGARPDLASGSLAPSHNPKAGRPRPDMEPDIRTFLVGYFEAELRHCAATFGGPALAWPARYGIAMT